MERSSHQRTGCLWWGAALTGYAALWLIFAIAWVMVADEISGMSAPPVLIPLIAFASVPLLIRATQPSKPLLPMRYLGATFLATFGLLLLFGVAAKVSPLSGYYLNHAVPMLWSWILVLTVGPLAGVGVYLALSGRHQIETTPDTPATDT